MKILLAVFIVYMLGGVYLYFIQDKKVFQKHYAKEYSPKNAEIIYFTTTDGIKLEGAYLENGKDLPLCLYFSGNANNVIEFIDKIGPTLNCNVIGFNYPGYVNSQGTPSEKTILKYAKEIYNHYNPDIVIGRSLGSAVASYVIERGKLILLTPFDSILNIAQNRYPIYPVKFLLKHHFNECEFLRGKNVEVYILALENDNVIPKKSLENLLKCIKNKKVYYFNGVKHGNIYESEEIIKKLQDIINSQYLGPIHRL